MLARKWRKGKLHEPWAGLQSGAAAMETGAEVPFLHSPALETWAAPPSEPTETSGTPKFTRQAEGPGRV